MSRMRDPTEGTTVARKRRKDFDISGTNAKPVMASAVAKKPLKALTPLDFQGIYTDMTRAGKAATTVRHTHTVVRDALSDAVEWGMIPFNPVDRTKPPKKTVAPVDTMSASDEARALLEVADHHRLKALW